MFSEDYRDVGKTFRFFHLMMKSEIATPNEISPLSSVAVSDLAIISQRKNDWRAGQKLK
ncbi:MAG: hypothetical protein ACRC2T_20590 [Thermoguttaceae bacterium]